mgnify:CR=1 FL=1
MKKKATVKKTNTPPIVHVIFVFKLTKKENQVSPPTNKSLISRKALTECDERSPPKIKLFHKENPNVNESFLLGSSSLSNSQSFLSSIQEESMSKKDDLPENYHSPPKQKRNFSSKQIKEIVFSCGGTIEDYYQIKKWVELGLISAEY